MDPSPHSQTQIGDLQKSYGTNWTKENITTIFEWLTIASFNILCLDLATKYYKHIIRNSVILGLVFSTLSGTISVSELVVKVGLSEESRPVLGYVLNTLFIIMTFTIATFTGYIKVYQIQENLERAIQYKQEWTLFSTSIASELQLPIELRKDAVWMIIKNKSKYLDLLKSEVEIPEGIRKSAHKQLNSQNILKFDVSNLTNIIMEIGSQEYNAIITNRHTPLKINEVRNEKLMSLEHIAGQSNTTTDKPEIKPEINAITLVVQ
jgi:hypothetical protein